MAQLVNMDRVNLPNLYTEVQKTWHVLDCKSWPFSGRGVGGGGQIGKGEEDWKFYLLWPKRGVGQVPWAPPIFSPLPVIDKKCMGSLILIFPLLKLLFVFLGCMEQNAVAVRRQYQRTSLWCGLWETCIIYNASFVQCADTGLKRGRNLRWKITNYIVKRTLGSYPLKDHPIALLTGSSKRVSQY